MLIVSRSIRYIKSLFPPKDKVAYWSSVINKGQCSCKLNYIGETKRHTEVCCKEHKDSAGKSEPVKHLISNASHKFTWTVLSAAFSHSCRRKIPEAFFFALRKPALAEQSNHYFLFFLLLFVLSLFIFWHLFIVFSNVWFFFFDFVDIFLNFIDLYHFNEKVMIKTFLCQLWSRL